ncbi:hypothetical protein B0H16DRAFT_1686849 [Mycena metata]|uniref:Uncharacterized protein n=1 Tax=Mycena metata TaxID=1033252 RepID=A0AAD7JNP7_9AGAR|nr:hypothetical protein B0H16DRAFT_1686849 [Mycena metata]
MATLVNASHDIRPIILGEHSGPTKQELLRFVPELNAVHSVSIDAQGTKEELAGRISEKLTIYEQENDMEMWDSAYQVWLNVQFANLC